MSLTQIPYQQEYQDYLEIECEKQPRSVEEYFMDLRLFFAYLEDNGLTDLAQDPARIRYRHTLDYLNYLAEERGNGPHAINRKMSSLKNYFNFLELTGRISDNPARRIKKIKLPSRLPAVLSLEEAQALIKASYRGYSYFPYRDHAMVRLFLQTGLRLSELVGIDTEDVDLQERQVRIRGKGDRERLLPLTEATFQALSEHLERRFPASPSITKVFLNQRGRPLTRRGVQMIFHRLCKNAGLIRPGLSVHKLRHTCLTLLMREGVDLMTLKELAGHDDITSTEIYAHVSIEDVRKAVEGNPLDKPE